MPAFVEKMKTDLISLLKEDKVDLAKDVPQTCRLFHKLSINRDQESETDKELWSLLLPKIVS